MCVLGISRAFPCGLLPNSENRMPASESVGERSVVDAASTHTVVWKGDFVASLVERCKQALDANNESAIRSLREENELRGVITRGQQDRHGHDRRLRLHGNGRTAANPVPGFFRAHRSPLDKAPAA